MKYLTFYLICINIIAGSAMIYDKRAAIKHRTRISEKTLFTLAIIGGSLGIIVVMYRIRHKTRHKTFIVGVPIILIIQLLLTFYLLFN